MSVAPANVDNEHNTSAVEIEVLVKAFSIMVCNNPLL